MAKRSLAALSLVVREYDDAIDFFTRVLRLRLLEDTDLGGGKRWVRVAFDGGSELLLARAASPEQQAAIGHQSGGRVFLFLHTDDFENDVAHLRSCGVRFTEAPRNEAYGRVVVFLDLYGNRWDLIEPARANS
ncbi:MAG: VOC family protein [Burkholderiales bacterium]|nr:VOC family protein [Burkholderiales bacterium]